MILLAEIDNLLREIHRLLPGEDAETWLQINPGIVLDMRSAGLPASLEIDDGLRAP